MTRTCSGTCPSQAPPKAPLIGERQSSRVEGMVELESHHLIALKGTDYWSTPQSSMERNQQVIDEQHAHLVPGPHLCHFLWSQGTFHLLPGETCGCHLIQGHPSITDGHLALCLSSCSARRWTVNMSTCKCAQSLQPWFLCWAISLEVLLTLQHPNKFKQWTWCGLVEMTQMPGSWRRNLRGK